MNERENARDSAAIERLLVANPERCADSGPRCAEPLPGQAFSQRPDSGQHDVLAADPPVQSVRVGPSSESFGPIALVPVVFFFIVWLDISSGHLHPDIFIRIGSGVPKQNDFPLFTRSPCSKQGKYHFLCKHKPHHFSAKNPVLLFSEVSGDSRTFESYSFANRTLAIPWYGAVVVVVVVVVAVVVLTLIPLPVQVLEMFGSSCDLHLEMPAGGETESETLDWWLIPPHQSKAVAKVSFLATRAVNLTAFVRWAALWIGFCFSKLGYRLEKTKRSSCL